MELAYAAVMDEIGRAGLPLGQDQCCIAAVHTMLQAYGSPLHKDCPWQYVSVDTLVGNKRRRTTSSGPVADVIISTCEDCFGLPEPPRGYSLVSFVSMDEVDLGDEMFVGHFSTYLPSRLGSTRGYFVYDDVLNLGPGDYQGGFVPASSRVHDKVLQQAKERVPLALFVKD